MGPSKGFLRSSRLFWPLKMVPSVARGHFDAKKVESSSKTPRKGPIKCFSQIKKKLSQTCRISSSLVFLCTYGLHTDTKSSKTSQSHRKTPQNGRFSPVPTAYCGGHMQKSTKKIQEICEFFQYTDLVYKQVNNLLLGTARMA